jgi:hypothetical protein
MLALAAQPPAVVVACAERNRVEVARIGGGTASARSRAAWSVIALLALACIAAWKTSALEWIGEQFQTPDGP